MIEELRIKDLGVIEHAHVQFGPGLNALTGETGAGKTMALTSLMMLMGAKIDSAKVRAGAQAAVVDGTFVVDAHSPAIDIVRNAGRRRYRRRSGRHLRQPSCSGVWQNSCLCWRPSGTTCDFETTK